MRKTVLIMVRFVDGTSKQIRLNDFERIAFVENFVMVGDWNAFRADNVNSIVEVDEPQTSGSGISIAPNSNPFVRLDNPENTKRPL